MTWVPHDVEAENALLGDMIALPDIIPDVAERVVPGDFYQLQAGTAFQLLVDGHRQGEPLDAPSLSVALKDQGQDPDPAWLHRVVSSGSSAWRTPAQAVVSHRVRRQVLEAVGEAGHDARDAAVEPSSVLDRLRGRLQTIDIPDGQPPSDLHTLDEFIDRPEHESAPWIVPGLLRVGWRVVIVGHEGHGKSTLWRQFAVLAAQGIHPLGFERIPKVRTLLVDLENPADAITQGCREMREHVTNRQIYEPGRAWLWHRPAGIDLRTRANRSELAAVCAATRPNLVCLGPLYKAYQRGRDSDEEAAAEVQHVLDELRTRFGFALLVEHHAPQDSQGFRKLRPYGSSLWLRWPEIGIAMEHDGQNKSAWNLERWRGDRMKSLWPTQIEQGGIWPWTGVWSDNEWKGIP